MLDWKPIIDHKTQKFPVDRIVVYSPAYPDNHMMQYRIMNVRFLPTATDATHWACLTPPKD